MATTATITIGTTDYTVYALTADPVSDADDYLAAKIGSTWSTATTLQKQQALISAARMLDRAVVWSGTKSSPSQALEWPRDDAVNGCDGTDVTDGTTPDNIALAEFELANQLFLDSTLADGTGTGSNVKRVKAGSAEVEFFTPTFDTDYNTRLPVAANDLARCYMSSAGTFNTRYGTESDDPGYDKEEFDRAEGYP
jgi:hypothetical protein